MRYEQDDKKKHLEFIQLTVNRMASNSFILKGWNITLIVGLFALSLNKSSFSFLYLALLPALAFWGLDAYYLRQERLFRELYDSIRKTKRKNIDPYSLNTQSVNGVKNWFRTMFSSTLISLHGSVMLFIIIFIIIMKGGI